MEQSFFDRPVADVAQDLLGTVLCVNQVGGVVVETEAYAQSDPASHSFCGPTKRNQAMFGPPGHAYVYRSYGMHWCMNMVCRPGSAVLIRALEPRHGLDIMKARRAVQDTRLLCRGPGRLCQALDITGSLDGVPLDGPPFYIDKGERPMGISVGRRIGISKGVDTEWRFCITGSLALSRKP